MERPPVNIVKRGSWSKTPNFGCFPSWSKECAEETDFGQLMTSLSNDTEDPL